MKPRRKKYKSSPEDKMSLIWIMIAVILFIFMWAGVGSFHDMLGDKLHATDYRNFIQ